MRPGFERVRHTRRLVGVLDGYARLPLLRAGLRLGIFQALRAPLSPAELAERLALAPDLVEAWARALHAEGWLRRRDEAYEVAPPVAWLLESPEAGALQTLLDHVVEQLAPRLAQLPELLKGAERPRAEPPEETTRVAAIASLVEGRALRALERIPAAPRPRQALEIGCGRGSFLAHLLKHRRDSRAVGIEVDPAAADEARRRLRDAEVSRRAEIRVGDLRDLELPGGGFDLVVLNHQLHRIAPSEYPTFFRRVAARLSADGVLAIQTPVLTEGSFADLVGLRATVALFDLVVRMHRNLYGLPDLALLHRALAEAGFGETGEVPVLPGGVVRWVWARAS